MCITCNIYTDFNHMKYFISDQNSWPALEMTFLYIEMLKQA